MYVKNAVYREIVPVWDEITLPLKAGTPMSANGTIANNANAVGLVPQTIGVRPTVPSISILVGGSVLSAEVNALYGSDLTAEAKQAMSGIFFYGSDGTPEPDPLFPGDESGGAGVVEVYDYGGYMTKEKKSGASYRYTKQEFSDLLNENAFVVWKTSVADNMHYAFAIIWRPAAAVTNASVIAVEQDGDCANYYGTITLSGTQTGYVSAPTLYTKASGGSVLTISEYSETTATEAAAAIENGSLIRFESYGVYYSCLYCAVNFEEPISVNLQCGRFNIDLYEDPSNNSYNDIGWPANDGAVDDGGGF